MITAYRFLEAHGLWNAVIWTATAISVGRVLAGRWLKRLLRLLRAHEQIADALNTDTPGGLTDLIAAMEDRKDTQP